MTPHNISRLYVDGGEGRRPEVATRSVNQIAETNRVREMNSHQTIGPDLFDSRFVSSASQLQDAAAAVVSARHEEQVVRSPNGRARVQTVVDRMRMTP